MTFLGLTLPEITLAISVVALGTAIQCAVGFGVALIAAPVLLLINRSLVPGPLIAAALCLTAWLVYSERKSVDMGHFRTALLGRLVGTPPAALLIGTASAATFDLVFGALVLLAIAISLVHAHIQPTPRNVFFATVASGFMSTISSIGGPPLALVFQNASGPVLRANLSMLFMMGCVVSLTGLALVGRFHLQDLAYSAMLIVGIVIGVLCSGPLRRLIDKQTARPWLLGLCSVSALLVLGRGLLQLLASG